MATREENTYEGGLSARCISILVGLKSKKLLRVEETERQIPQRMAMRHQTGGMLANGHKQQRFLSSIQSPGEVLWEFLGGDVPLGGGNL